MGDRGIKGHFGGCKRTMKLPNWSNKFGTMPSLEGHQMHATMLINFRKLKSAITLRVFHTAICGGSPKTK
jgi:hypothetical protein